MSRLAAIGLGILLAVITAAISITWPSAAVVAHVLWLGLSAGGVMVFVREQTSTLSGWRRGAVWIGGTLTILLAYVMLYAGILLEGGTDVLGWRS